MEYFILGVTLLTLGAIKIWKIEKNIDILTGIILVTAGSAFAGSGYLEATSQSESNSEILSWFTIAFSIIAILSLLIGIFKKQKNIAVGGIAIAIGGITILLISLQAEQTTAAALNVSVSFFYLPSS